MIIYYHVAVVLVWLNTVVKHFCEFFGTTAPVLTTLWKLLTEHTLIPEEGTIKHLLWTLHFFRAYPKQAVACSTVGGSGVLLTPKRYGTTFGRSSNRSLGLFQMW
jgi:hypothetical protein